MGTKLFNWFFKGQFKEAVECEGLSRPWDILHDQMCSIVPFEMMQIRDRCPALEKGIRRGLLVKNQGYQEPPNHRPIYHILLIVNPSGDLDGAETEGFEIQAMLEREFGGEHSLPRMEIKMLLHTEATRENVLREVTTGKYDFIHYAGHGNFVPDNADATGLILNDGMLTADQLQQSLAQLYDDDKILPGEEDRHPPVLVLLNACLSSKLMRERDEFGVSLAQAVLQSGVGGFIGNRWNVGDQAAREFAIRIISGLANGISLGEAIRRGRRMLFDSKQKDWCNYVFYGSPEIRL
jgi:hypothetical protein